MAVKQCLLSLETMGVETSRGYNWPTLLAIQLVHCRVVGIINVFCWLPNYADKRIVDIHIYFCEALNSPTERVAVSFEQKPLRLRFW